MREKKDSRGQQWEEVGGQIVIEDRTQLVVASQEVAGPQRACRKRHSGFGGGWVRA